MPPDAAMAFDTLNGSTSIFAMTTEDTRDIAEDYPASSLLNEISEITNVVIFPIVFSLGIVGNFFCVVVFTQKIRRRFKGVSDKLDKSATIGLLLLAVSDFLFSLCGLLRTVLPTPDNNVVACDERSLVLALYYNTFSLALLNVWLVTSTWITCAVSFERFFAVYYPFRVKWMISGKRTCVIYGVILTFSVLINLPSFFFNRVKFSSRIFENVTSCLYYQEPTVLYVDATYFLTYHFIWQILAVTVPTVIMAVCNFKLIQALRDKNFTNFGEFQNNKVNRITFILVLIVSLYLLLVAPNSLLVLLQERLVPMHSKSYQAAITLTNLMQAINFTVNFVLYIVFSEPFRITFVAIFLPCFGKRRKSKRKKRRANVQVNVKRDNARTIELFPLRNARR